MSTADWITVCAVNDIPELGARRVRRPDGADIALFRTASGSVRALLDRCPHRGGPLSQGIVFGESVACPLHNWAIALRDGRAQAPDEGCTPVFAVDVLDGQVRLRRDQFTEPFAEPDAEAGSCNAACAGTPPPDAP